MSKIHIIHQRTSQTQRVRVAEFQCEIVAKRPQQQQQQHCDRDRELMLLRAQLETGARVAMSSVVVVLVGDGDAAFVMVHSKVATQVWGN